MALSLFSFVGRARVGVTRVLVKMDEETSDFGLSALSVPADGDCLFHSVAMILHKRYSELKEEGSLPAPSSVSRYLRSRVALRVLDETDEECTHVIELWHTLWVDAVKERQGELMNELRHMHNVHRPLSAMDRRVLFGNMMNRDIYWGDEFALQTMEKVLNCMFVVVNERLHVVQRDYGAAGEDKEWMAMLLLRGQHYEPVYANDGSYSWSMEDIPEQLKPMIALLLQKKGASTAPAPAPAPAPEPATEP